MPGTTYAGRSLLDPEHLLQVCLDRQLPTEHWFAKANLFRVPLGRGPGRGAVLLTKADLDAIDLTASADLVFDDGSNDPLTLKSIYFTGASCILPGREDDPDSPFLVELADDRLSLLKIPISKAYNMRSADGSEILPATQNTGSDWTWADLNDDLWTALGISTPTLPFTPDGTLENFNYYDFFAWEAVNDFLDRLACAPKYDPTTETYSIVRLGADDATASANLSSLSPLTWNEQPIRSTPAERPESVRVLFRRFPAPTDGNDPYYAIDTTLSAEDGTVSGSFVTLYDDLGALAATGTPTNSTLLTARAAERVSDWQRKYDKFDDPLVTVYGGIRKETMDILGSLVGDMGIDDRGGGYHSQVVAEPTRSLEDWRPRFTEASAGGSDNVVWIKPTASVANSFGNWPGVLRVPIDANTYGDGDAIRLTFTDIPTTSALDRLFVAGNAQLGTLLGSVSETQTPRTVTDGVTTSGSMIVTSATAAFTSADVGAAITGSGIPSSTTIASVQSSTSVTLSANDTATASGVSLTITPVIVYPLYHAEGHHQLTLTRCVGGVNIQECWKIPSSWIITNGPCAAIAGGMQFNRTTDSSRMVAPSPMRI